MQQQKPMQFKNVVVDSVLTKEDMETAFSNSFTVVSSVDDVSGDVQIALTPVLEKLKEKGFMYNYNNDGKDSLSQHVYSKYKLLSSVMLPFKGFNAAALTDEDGEAVTPTILEPTIKAHKVAAKYKYKNELDENGRFRYNTLNEHVKKFSARDVHLLLGDKVGNKVKFIIIMSNDKAEAMNEVDYKTIGSVGFPLKIATSFDIPVFNISKPGRINDLLEYLNTI